jgi:hypothetical protein
MSVISNLWGQLVQRRLWPVAVLLIAALAAVPLFLAEEPETAPAPAPAAAPADASAELATDPIVAMATESDRAKRRKVLGKPKNPFAKPAQMGGSAQDGPTPAPAPSAPEPGGSGASGGADTPTAVSGGSSGGTVSPAPSVPSPAAPVAPAEPPQPERPAHERDSLTVRFGDSSGEGLARTNVKRLEALPVGEEPLIVYLGTADGGESAVFLIDESVKGEGDGRCMPDPSTCETIRLREGETEFFDILGEDGEPAAQYQLDLVEIHAGKKKASAAKVRSASKPVRRVLRARAASALHYRLDAESGTVRITPAAKLRATVAGTAAVGLALP